MSADERAAQLDAVRREIAPALPKNVDARTVELAAFGAVGQRDLALRLWADARSAAEAARRTTKQKLRDRFGARNPNSWLSITLILGAICAAVAAVLTSGIRFDPAATAGAVAVLAAAAAATALLVLIVGAGRPLNRAVVRIHAIVTVALMIAAALQAGRGLWPQAGVTIGAAVVGLVGFVVLLVVRGRDGVGTEEIDTAINIAYADTEPEVEAVALRLRAEAERALTADQAARIVDLRTATLAGLAADGIRLPDVDPSLPAGAVIIDALLSTWIPKVLQGERGL
ncbi:hypothetical protein N3K63_05375 [Microbacterium sp. W1N]|uniref:hypothetical protein n=1 Tax=Microbacterium festucae TaxID=2977531 RepID=UPI0021C122F0|nr:hypothetical protein [Microbacterium festucae]MCT9819716.1 hypothetical protein [Microbacterium festucae]